jgi:bifunctional DNase/RNase
MLEMRVAGIALDAASRSPIVLLRDPASRRQVPIWIDQAQAQNILAGLGNEKPPRPLSHDLMVTLLEAGDLQLERVIIHAIEESTFRAVLKLSRGEGRPGVELDARPSDAIALALRTGSSIWMLEEVVADASMPVDAEADAEEAADFRRFLDSVSPAELVRHLSKARPEPEPEPPAGNGGTAEGGTGEAGSAEDGADDSPEGSGDTPSDPAG